VNELYLFRHAKTVPQSDNVRDTERALEERGRVGARRMAKWLKQQKIVPDVVLCSPAVRTRETLDLVADAFPRKPRIEYEPGLYLATGARLMERLREIPDSVERVMVVGHNPGLHELAQALTDRNVGPLAERLAANLATAGLARFEVAIEWSGLRRRGARLVALVSPKDLD